MIVHEVMNKLAHECEEAIDTKNVDEIDALIIQLSNLVRTEGDNFDTQVRGNFFLSNIYSAKAKAVEEDPLNWHKNFAKELQNSIRALHHCRIANRLVFKIKTHVKYEIKTNLGNCFYKFGRYIEAFKYWNADFSKGIDSPYVSCLMKAKTLYYVGLYIQDVNHKALYIIEAGRILNVLHINMHKTSFSHKGIESELQSEYVLNIEKSAIAAKKYIKPIESISYNFEYINEEEKLYKKWCAKNYLFLNHLNDISTEQVVAHDVLQFPDYGTEIDPCEP